MRRSGAIMILAACVGISGCDDGQAVHMPDPGLERMVRQPRLDPYGGSAFFADGRAMRPTPAGTMSRDGAPRVGTIATGRDGDRWAERAPLPIDRPLLERGRRRFGAFCSACHGVLGDGDSAVARRMELVRPRDLQSAEALAYPIGRIYGAATAGYGLMPSYTAQLDQRDRWAVAAYVKSLQLSRHARVDELPAQMRERARRELP